MLQGQVTDAAGRATGGGLAGKLIPWAAQIIVAVILAQTLFFKLTYAPETQWIFNAERGGRAAATFVGVLELVCVVLILIPRTAALGALLSLVTLSGAICTHLFVLGVPTYNPEEQTWDGGFLFALALVVAAGSLVVLAFRRRQLPFVGRLVTSG